MTKTEHEIAERYLKDLKKYKKPDGRWHLVNRTCHEHMFACQRFLEFLEEIFSVHPYVDNQLEKKITDLNNAIKEYKNAGI